VQKAANLRRAARTAATGSGVERRGDGSNARARARSAGEATSTSSGLIGSKSNGTVAAAMLNREIVPRQASSSHPSFEGWAESGYAERRSSVTPGGDGMRSAASNASCTCAT